MSASTDREAEILRRHYQHAAVTELLGAEVAVRRAILACGLADHPIGLGDTGASIFALLAESRRSLLGKMADRGAAPDAGDPIPSETAGSVSGGEPDPGGDPATAPEDGELPDASTEPGGP